MQEQYFSAKYLTNLTIGTVMQMKAPPELPQLNVKLIGVAEQEAIITSYPAKHTLNDDDDLNQLIEIGTAYEVHTVSDGKVIAFESTILDHYQAHGPFIVYSFPEMVEVRTIRRETRFPCSLSCDIRCNNIESYAAISNISIGGCMLFIDEPIDISWLHEAQRNHTEIELEVMFPFADHPFVLLATVKSVQQKEGHPNRVGFAFNSSYDVVYRYLDSLSLEGISAFFS